MERCVPGLWDQGAQIIYPSRDGHDAKRQKHDRKSHRNVAPVALKAVDIVAKPKRTVAGPSFGAGYALGLLEFAVSLGAGRDELLRRSKIDARDLDDLDNRIALDRYVALISAAAELAGEPAMPLKYGEAVRMQDLSIVGLICEACETTLDVGAQLNRYSRLVYDTGDGRPADVIRLEHDERGMWLKAVSPIFDAHPFIAESEFARLAWNTRVMFAGHPHLKEHPFPLEMQFTHQAPSYRAAFELCFQAPVSFGMKWNAMRIHPDFLSLRQPPTNRYVFGVLSERANALLKSLENAATVRGQVEGLLIPELHKGDPGVEKIADKMGLSRQTLYRKLKAEGVTFEKLLDELRHKMALHYLNGKKVSVNEAAYLVGFSEPSAFSRAFKRWTGSSPKAMRAS
jgi:AraC-like DNA-binding protein